MPFSTTNYYLFWFLCTARHGNGVYFAKEFLFSADDLFSPPDPDGNKYVFLCNVLTGTFCKGNAGDNEPHIRDGVQTYDSMVSKVRRPSTFVIFHDAQAYPAYLLLFDSAFFTFRKLIYEGKLHL